MCGRDDGLGSRSSDGVGGGLSGGLGRRHGHWWQKGG